MKDVYEKTNWVENQTYLNAKNLNKIEDALEDLYGSSISVSQLRGETPLRVDIAEDQLVNVSINKTELNKLIEHKVYKGGNGIILNKEEKSFNPDEDSLDELLDEKDPATILNLDEDYVNRIVEHPQIEGGDGIKTSIIEDIPVEPTSNEVENENSSEDTSDTYVRPKQPTTKVEVDLDFLNKNISHPTYLGVKGVKIRKPSTEYVFPEDTNPETTMVAYLDKDFINNKVIDVDKIAEKLNLNPIVKYSAGNGIQIISEDEKTEDSFIEDEEKIISEDEYLNLEDKDIPNVEATEIIKDIKLDEDYLKDFINETIPNLSVEEGLTITRNTDEETSKVTDTISPNVNKLKELMEITPHPTITSTKGLLIEETSPSSEENIESTEENSIYDPKPSNINISLVPKEIKELIGYTPHPIIKVEEGIDMVTKEITDENGDTQQIYRFSINQDWINEIVKHQIYKFDTNWFKYSEDSNGIGYISVDDSKLAQFVKKVIEKENE